MDCLATILERIRTETFQLSQYVSVTVDDSRIHFASVGFRIATKQSLQQSATANVKNVIN